MSLTRDVLGAGALRALRGLKYVLRATAKPSSFPLASNSSSTSIASSSPFPCIYHNPLVSIINLKSYLLVLGFTITASKRPLIKAWLPTLSLRSSCSTNTLRSLKPPGWSGSGSTRSNPAKAMAKNNASAVLSYVFSKPEVVSLGDGLGAVTTLSTSTSSSKSAIEEQSTLDDEGKGVFDTSPHPY